MGWYTSRPQRRGQYLRCLPYALYQHPSRNRGELWAKPRASQSHQQLATLSKLELAATRLHQIQDEDAYLFEKDPVSKAYIYGRAIGYLFGKTKNGVHVDGTGKLDEVSLKVDKQYAYVVDLVNGIPTKDPKVSFSFDDPDVVKWRVLEAKRHPGHAGEPMTLQIELYGMAPRCSNSFGCGILWHKILFEYVSVSNRPFLPQRYTDKRRRVLPCQP